MNVGGGILGKDNLDSLYGPNFRMLASLDDNEDSYFIIDTGINENVMSKHYKD